MEIWELLYTTKKGKYNFFFEKNNIQEEKFYPFSATESQASLPEKNRDEFYVGYYPHELQKWQIGFTMTVHKSQGSEYENVLFVLPEESAEFCNRSLIYTAFSRTKKRCIAFFKKQVFLEAVSRTEQQQGSELQDYLEEILF